MELTDACERRSGECGGAGHPCVCEIRVAAKGCVSEGHRAARFRAPRVEIRVKYRLREVPVAARLHVCERGRALERRLRSFDAADYSRLRELRLAGYGHPVKRYIAADRRSAEIQIAGAGRACERQRRSVKSECAQRAGEGSAGRRERRTASVAERTFPVEARL